MSNQTIPKKSKKRTGRTVLVAAAALVACALLVQATIAPLDLSGDGRSSSEQTDSLESSPSERLRLAVPESDVDVEMILADAQARLDLLLSEQSAEAHASIAHVLSSLDATLASTGNLPSVPGDYLPGFGVEAPPLQVSPYAVPVLESTMAIDGFIAPVWSAVPSDIPEHPGVVEGVDTEELQAAIEEVFALIEDILASEELQDIIVMLEDVAGSSPLGPVPLGAPDLSDAEGLIAPHEEGATAAFDHADLLLSSADGAIGGLSAEAEEILALQGDLVAEVQAILSETEQTVFDASQGIVEESVARGEATTEDLLKTQQLLQAMLSSYLEQVDVAAGDAVGSIQEIANEHTASVQAGLDAEIGVLDSTLSNLEADTEERLEMLRFEAHRIVRDLEDSGATQVEIDGFLSTVDELSLSVQEEADAATVALEGAIASFSSLGTSSISDVNDISADTIYQVEDLVSSAQADLDSRVAYASEFATAQAEATIELQQKLAQETVSDLQALASSEAERLIDTTTSAVSQVHSDLGFGLELLGSVQGEVMNQVGSDLEYILKVAEDYGTAPVPEREERAEFWTSVHSNLDGTLGTVIVAGSQAEGTVAQALALSEANLAGLESL